MIERLLCQRDIDNYHIMPAPRLALEGREQHGVDSKEKGILGSPASAQKTMRNAACWFEAAKTLANMGYFTAHLGQQTCRSQSDSD